MSATIQLVSVHHAGARDAPTPPLVVGRPHLFLFYLAAVEAVLVSAAWTDSILRVTAVTHHIRSDLRHTRTLG